MKKRKPHKWGKLKIDYIQRIMDDLWNSNIITDGAFQILLENMIYLEKGVKISKHQKDNVKDLIAILKKQDKFNKTKIGMIEKFIKEKMGKYYEN
jgi:hypothetical protein